MDTPHSPHSDVRQFPAPGTSMVMFCGDCLEFSLTVSSAGSGRAYVRTNLGAAARTRREIIHRVEKNEIKLGADWVDLPMGQQENGRFTIHLPLTQTGYFQAKCFFLPQSSDTPVWPGGENTTISVAPAGTCCANIIYNAFVRQFGPGLKAKPEDPLLDKAVEDLDKKGYTVIPESGKFRDLKRHIQFIFGEMGCRVLHLLPIHPTPTTYARMGRFGSPYAALDFTDVDPALAVFDPAATPLEQFLELVDAVHACSGYLVLDIAINHTGWAASIHESNPQWLDREDDGKIKAPGAWGVVWEDLTKLDFSHTDLWQYMAGVFLLWCRRGVDGFRCDAGYMIPVRAWEYIIAKVRQEYPDTVFFLEGLGGPLQTTRDLLGKADFNWAYSELFQHYTAEQIARYLPFALEMSGACGHLIHFAETHDNDRLAKTSHTYAKMRTGLCALFSTCGGFGFANGVEWFAREKINVHQAPSLNWGNPVNQVAYLSRLILILREHPAFDAGATVELIQEGQGSALVLRRTHSTGQLFILVNLDCLQPAGAAWPAGSSGKAQGVWTDLISARPQQVDAQGEVAHLILAPGEVMALTQDNSEVSSLDRKEKEPRTTPERVLLQKRRALALCVVAAVRGNGDTGTLDVDRAAMAVARDPVSFIRSLDPGSRESRVVIFDGQRDLNRQTMVPPGFFLMVQCPFPFRAELVDADKDKTSLGFQEGLPPVKGSLYRAIFMPRAPREKSLDCLLRLRIFKEGKTLVETAHIRYLPPGDALVSRSMFRRPHIARDLSLKHLSTTCQGGMMRAAADFGHLESRYDGVLGANLNPDLPEDRWMLLARYRAWGVFQGYSRKLGLDCLQTFWSSHDKGCRWRFRIPTSEGRYYVLSVWLAMDPVLNRVVLTAHRETRPGGSRRRLEDGRAVSLIIRPDVEDRSFHETVKAFTGPEHLWPDRVKPFDTGFTFASDRGQVLQIWGSERGFFPEPEWQYMVSRELESQRGLEHCSDLFSPGYFRFSLKGGQTVRLEAVVALPTDLPGNLAGPAAEEKPFVFPEMAPAIPFFEAAKKSMDAFIVDRNGLKSVIAGFPWFLDWGRDSLIFCRGLIEMGRTQEALAILRLFGQFENQGTLPNMICGADARNIETSDAPLWFFACCRQLMPVQNDPAFLDTDMGGRPLGRLLRDMAESMIRGTPTGVRTHPGSFLLFSPAHFTWMDTNFPAATPRQGFPVEIQALWHHALSLLAAISPDREKKLWADRAAQVRQAIMDRFWLPDQGYFADCLVCPASTDLNALDLDRAVADDALRPNQLLLITLGAVADQGIMQQAVETCQELLVPGAIRSLANRPLTHPLEIRHGGKLLADPHAPYAGTYEGDEDTRRKPAYHNGTAWTWLFPVFCEAWAEVFRKPGIPAALAWLGSSLPLMGTGAVGFFPEILDGDYPHTPRGCDAQAWASSELVRVAEKLTRLSVIH